MAGEKPCSKLQSFFMTEGQRIIKSRMQGQAGEKVEAQIANAAIALDLPYVTCWRAYQGRCGERAFQKLYAADRELTAREKREDKAALIVERLDRVEQSLAELVDRLEAANCERSDVGVGEGPRLSVAHASA